jgi:hypothetical protein
MQVARKVVAVAAAIVDDKWRRLASSSRENDCAMVMLGYIIWVSMVESRKVGFWFGIWDLLLFWDTNQSNRPDPY